MSVINTYKVLKEINNIRREHLKHPISSIPLGDRCSPTSCPIAIALKARVGWSTYTV